MVKALIAAGASKDDRLAKSHALISAAGEGSLNIVRLLIGYGAEPGRSKIGVTFLMAAADSGIPAIVEEALKFRPEVNARDKSGETALYHATNDIEGADQSGNRAAIARLLIKAGARPNIRGENGNTALHETMDEGFARVLIKAGAKVSARNKDGETPLISTWDKNVARALIEAGADLDAKDGNGDTALDMARHNHLEDKVNVIEQALTARNKK
jgi:cytohesin